MSTNPNEFLSPLNILAAGPDKATLMDAYQKRNDPSNTGVEFSLTKLCRNNGGLASLVGSNSKVLSGKLVIIPSDMVVLNDAETQYLILAYAMSDCILKGEPIPVVPFASHLKVDDLTMGDATETDAIGITAWSYVEMTYDTGAMRGAVVFYDNGKSIVSLPSIQKLTNMDPHGRPPIPRACYGTVTETPVAQKAGSGSSTPNP